MFLNVICQFTNILETLRSVFIPPEDLKLFVLGLHMLIIQYWQVKTITDISHSLELFIYLFTFLFYLFLCGTGI
jgi:hypothetical protein